jgi:hypothetical protein
MGECTSACICVGVEPLDVTPQSPHQVELGADLFEVRRGVLGVRDVDDPGALVVAVDVVLLDRGLDLVEVPQAELFEDLDLVGPAGHRVAEPVGQAGVHEAAVAARRGRTALGGVDQHDVAGRVALLGDDGGPEPGVAAADDGEVAALGADERRVGVGLVGVLVPVRILVGVGDRVEMPLIDLV